VRHIGPADSQGPNTSFATAVAQSKAFLTRVAIIGSGTTGIYTLQGLIDAPRPLTITVLEETPEAEKGTPYLQAENDSAMLAKIASIKLPPIQKSVRMASFQN
jgi:ornithine cyclodeaminase/alanine dehydrogenase-like protein (mu-crystallin family)